MGSVAMGVDPKLQLAVSNDTARTDAIEVNLTVRTGCEHAATTRSPIMWTMLGKEHE